MIILKHKSSYFRTANDKPPPTEGDLSMARLATPTHDNAPAESRPLLDGVFKKFGVIPNLFRVCALSPAALTGLLSLNEANSRMLDAKTRTRIAIAVAQVNGCDYCLSAHTISASTWRKFRRRTRRSIARAIRPTRKRARPSGLRQRWPSGVAK